ncbi:hypothetical protein [Endozoicomonas arenosclerae]|uniref:hypothetical protein n=1 Tax=Endozoicomonas arenosclerae TaxID=1633495 RepID=UPI000AB54B75|nr:hypothetical protein [Endozoicomonas arenosclerae]
MERRYKYAQQDTQNRTPENIIDQRIFSWQIVVYTSISTQIAGFLHSDGNLMGKPSALPQVTTPNTLNQCFALPALSSINYT